MPGPMHKSPRHPGPRPDPEGDPRKANRKQAKRLAAREMAFEALTPPTVKLDGSFHRPGSQNRKKG